MQINSKNICCIGAGYVGGPSMTIIAKYCPDIQVNIVDIDEHRINSWNSLNLDNLPIYEPGLKEIVKKCRGKNLNFSTDLKKNILRADIIFISVNTPTKTKGIGAGQAIDLKWVEKSARQIAKYAKGHTIVIEKSTLPVRTAKTIKEILENHNIKNDNKSFSILSNPEFLAEGTAISDLENPDRVLIGGEDQEAISELSNIYKRWVKKEKILTTDLWSSELSKLIANAFLAQRISSINSFSSICEKTGANIKDVQKAIGMDKRIGNKFLNVSPGFGGSCFKKDILNLIYICNHYGYKKVAKYWEQVIEINNWQQDRITNLIVEKLFGTISEKKIAILGFSFKANTNDTRESPAIKICRNLIEEGGKLQIYDPKVNDIQIKKDLNNSVSDNESNSDEKGSWKLCSNLIDSTINADALVILTEWDEFKEIDWREISKRMRSPAWVFDTRLITNIDEAKLNGFNIWCIGRGDL